MGDCTIGARCDAVGLRSDNVVSQIKQVSLTNGILIELEALKPPVDWKAVAEELDINLRSLQIRLTRIKKKYGNASKNGGKAGKKAVTFLDESVSLPKRRVFVSPKKGEATESCQNCLSLLQAMKDEGRGREERRRERDRKLEESEKKRLLQKRKTRNANKKLKELRSLIGSAGKAKDVVRQLKRLRESRTEWRRKCRELSSTCAKLENRHRRALKRCQMYRSRLYRLASRHRKVRSTMSLSPNENIQDVNYIKDLHNTVDRLEKQVKSLTGALQHEDEEELSASV